MDFPDTIFALSSGHLPSGIAVVRISGSASRDICIALVGRMPKPRTATLTRLRDVDGSTLDHGLILWLPGPASFTGEDVLELHLHGGRATVAAVLNRLGAIGGARMAEAGEFSRRAFLNGKFDLTQAEAMSDLIEAETEAERKLALRSAEGGQRDLYEAWRARLLHAQAMIEVEFDFSDQADIPGSISDLVWSDVEVLAGEIEHHCADARRAEIVKQGLDVVVIGAPNAGKSSLINALVQREAAIVTPEPGTTRDLIEVLLDLDGHKVRLTDTAGLRSTSNIAEQIGIQRAERRAAEADLVLYLRAIDDLVAAEPSFSAKSGQTVVVATKADLLADDPRLNAGSYDIMISSVSGAGLDQLRHLLSSEAGSVEGKADIMPLRKRQVDLLNATRECLISALAPSRELEFRAEFLRRAAGFLGRVTGRVDVEDILGVIFSTFCVGK